MTMNNLCQSAIYGEEEVGGLPTVRIASTTRIQMAIINRIRLALHRHKSALQSKATVLGCVIQNGA
jgi:hypothetical protein